MARGRRSSNWRGTPRRSTRRGGNPDVYDEMVTEAVSSAPTSLNSDAGTTKRRRVGSRVQTRRDNDDDDDASEVKDEPAEDRTHNSQVQTAYADSESSEDEDDIGWEDVNVDGPPGSERETSVEDRTEDLDLVLDDAAPSPARRARTRVKPLTAAERKLRLEIHKMHLLCLLSHVDLRNEWCNDNKLLVRFRCLINVEMAMILC